MNVADNYKSLKPYLFAIAYNMTGQVQEAEDIIQDAFADVMTKPMTDVRNEKSFLTRIVMNKAIDRIGQLKKEREHYSGLWLPEPYVAETESMSNGDILSYAFMYLLEQLNPLERAVLILREAFDYDYKEIAELCEISVDNCRQLLHRAKSRIKEPLKEKTPLTEANKKILDEFLKACLANDTAALETLLRKDALLYSDGGGKVVAARKILEGIENVGKFIFGVIRKTFDKWTAAHHVTVNGQPGLWLPDHNGVYMILIPRIEQGKIVEIFMMRNPDKIFLKKLSQNDG